MEYNAGLIKMQMEELQKKSSKRYGHIEIVSFNGLNQSLNFYILRAILWRSCFWLSDFDFKIRTSSRAKNKIRKRKPRKRPRHFFFFFTFLSCLTHSVIFKMQIINLSASANKLSNQTSRNMQMNTQHWSWMSWIQKIMGTSWYIYHWKNSKHKIWNAEH